MEVIKLKPCALAPVDADFIRMEVLPSGRLCLMGSAGGASAGIIDLGTHTTVSRAEAEDLRWAASQEVQTLYIETRQ